MFGARKVNPETRSPTKAHEKKTRFKSCGDGSVQPGDGKRGDTGGNVVPSTTSTDSQDGAQNGDRSVSRAPTADVMTALKGDLLADCKAEMRAMVTANKRGK